MVEVFDFYLMEMFVIERENVEMLELLFYSGDNYF